MGNDHSHLSGVEIEEKSVEVSDFWTQHCATVLTSGKITNLTILIGELFVDGPLWSSKTPLEKSSKNLMIYRHPCIVKYISSWQKSSKFYLALEELQPLSHVLGKQNTLQICIGLHSILKSLCFLHERASVSHNNVCTSSIYVTKDGNWKLGGMEFLCRFTDLTSDYLRKSRLNRYSKAVDTKEEEHLQKCERRDFIDAYSFGILVSEVFKGRNNDEVECLSVFYDLCKNELQNVDPSLRPKLSTLLDHEFFNHDFIKLHSFLIELPVKSDEEKTEFFKNLLEKLRLFNEITVAVQLGGLLLSRMVLLNKTAQEELLPHILTPRISGTEPTINNDGGLFSEDAFRKYLSPKLLEIFAVRDAQIRLLLLNSLPNFMHTFTKDELQSHILPELLVGIKDTNDMLVAATLRTLGDLVPILGATTVIGGKRAKLFNDGRPITRLGRRQSRGIKRQDIAPLPIRAPAEVIVTDRIIDLPERPRPDGEEVETSTEEVEPSLEEDNDNWDDWDMNTNNTTILNSSNATEELLVDLNGDNNNSSQINEVTSSEPPFVRVDSSSTIRKKPIPDITELDIKNQTASDSTDGDEFNFFQDMEPIIESATKFAVEKKNDEDLLSSFIGSKLDLNMTDDNENGASWGDEEWE